YVWNGSRQCLSSAANGNHHIRQFCRRSRWLPVRSRRVRQRSNRRSRLFVRQTWHPVRSLVEVASSRFSHDRAGTRARPALTRFESILMPHVSQSRFRVRYAETDQMGMAYYANYLVWMEVGRSDFCRDCGFSYRELEHDEKAFLTVAEANCRYLAPARYD